MKYFRIDIKRFYDNDMIATNANGDKILNGSSYFWKMDKGELIQDAPIFDYFYLESFDEKKHWEWQINDVHGFIGEGSQISGWLISVKLKTLLEKFKIASPCFYYLSKLLYKGRKMDYYIFQFSGRLIYEQTLLYIDYSHTIFWNPVKKENVMIENKEDFLPIYKKIYKENGSIDKVMQNKKLVLNNELDFFPMQNFLKDNIVSERLKQAIEENGITGFEFSELDYEVVVDQSV